MDDEGHEKLSRDLEIAAAMAAEMREYVLSDVLFWPMASSNMPRLTLGGYLMRQHRLLLARHLLTPEEQTRLGTVMDEYEAVVGEWVVHVENKAHQEIGARIRQWTEYLRDVREDRQARIATYYATAVEARAMIEALMHQLETPPFKPEPRLQQEIDLLDKRLKAVWKAGDFVWPSSWQPAYPIDAYWWLYGTPK